MLRPNRDEGERPKHHNSIGKAPLLLATALLVGYPLCLGQAAFASTSFASPGQLLHQQQTVIDRLKQSQPKSYQGQRLLSSTSLPSESEISSLESILSGYQSKLASLRAQAESRPDLSETTAPLISGLEREISNLASDISSAKALRQAYATVLSNLTKATDTYNKVSSSVNELTSALDSAKATLQVKTTAQAEAASTLATATAKLTQAKALLASATTSRQLAQDELAQATTTRQEAQSFFAAASSEYSSALTAYNSLLASEQQASSTYLAAQLQLTQAQQALTQAQLAYDTNLIPDPSWTVPTYQQERTRQVEQTRTVPVTTLVPTTTYVTTGGVLAEVFNRQGYNNAPPLPFAGETPISSMTVPNISFQWGGGPVLNSGRAEDVIVRFTGNLLFPTSGYYRFYTPADDGTKLTIAGMNLIDDWYDKGGGGSISEPVYIMGGVLYPFTLHYYENGGGAAVWFYSYTDQTGFEIIPAAYMGTSVQTTTTYQEVTTYQQETYYVTETYYTTEPLIVEQQVSVDIGEGGESTFTAPPGAVFVSSSLRYEAYDDPSCGADVTPSDLGSNTIQLVADNSIWGDTCGGQVKHLVGTLTYLGQPTAPLISNPALLPAVQAAQVAVTQAQASKEYAESTLDDTQSSLSDIIIDLDLATSNLDDAALDLADATAELSEAQADVTAALVAETTATANQTTTSSELATVQSLLALAQTELSTAQADVASKETAASTASLQLASALEEKASAETTLSSTQTRYQAVIASASQVKPNFALVETELAKPEPEPEEEGSKEIPKELSAENLMKVDLKKVDPTELTEKQAEQLKEAALETFETATQGSPEYQQALEALFVAAQQDDLTLPEELAAVPGLAAAVEVLNFLGNAGADMSPQVREESEKVVVATVVAAGAAIQSAAAAASAASASAGSSGSRR